MALQVSGVMTVTQDPKIYNTRNGDEDRIVMNLATAAFKPRKEEGEHDYYHNVTIFTYRGSQASKVRKGDIIVITGGTWVIDEVEKDGSRRYYHKIQCNNYNFDGPYSFKSRNNGGGTQTYADEEPGYPQEPRERPRSQHQSGPMQYESTPPAPDYPDSRTVPPPPPPSSSSGSSGSGKSTSSGPPLPPPPK